MSIGSKIKKLRESAGYSQTDFADKIDVSKQTLYKYENGIVTNIPSDRIEAIARLCNVDPAYIMGWTTQMHPAAAPASDPLRDYYARLIEYLDSSPAHRQLISDAAHVRAEDIDMIRPLLQRCADPDSSAPDLPDLSALQSSPTLESLRVSNKFCESKEKSFEHANSIVNAVELTDETLALVRDTPEVLRAEAEYIKKMSVEPPKRNGTASPSTGDEGRKSG